MCAAQCSFPLHNIFLSGSLLQTAAAVASVTANCLLNAESSQQKVTLARLDVAFLQKMPLAIHLFRFPSRSQSCAPPGQHLQNLVQVTCEVFLFIFFFF